MSNEIQQPDDQQIDVRTLPAQRRHAEVFEAYQRLETGQSVVVIDDHDPDSLRDEFDRELAGSFIWETLPALEQAYRVRITKRARTALPRVMANTETLLHDSGADTGGSIWQLTPGTRDLDSNIIALPAHDEIAQHIGPDLDVLILVLHGSGDLHTELNVIALHQGALVWLPRKAQRRFIAGQDGLQYLTVHQRKPTLNITAAPQRPARHS